MTSSEDEEAICAIIHKICFFLCVLLAAIAALGSFSLYQSVQLGFGNEVQLPLWMVFVLEGILLSIPAPAIYITAKMHS